MSEFGTPRDYLKLVEIADKMSERAEALCKRAEAAEAQNAKLKAALEHIHTITIQKTVIDTVYEICDEALAECEGNGE